MHPAQADAEYVWRMEDVIQTYSLPYDPAYPVVCFDEACKQLFGEVRPPLPAQPGSPAKRDYEYERKGVCNQLMMCEPLRGWRHVKVSERRTRRGLCPLHPGIGRGPLPAGARRSAWCRTTSTPTTGRACTRRSRRSSPSPPGQDRVALHAQARQLAEHGRDGDPRS